jgi:hypothetical protein
MVTKVLERVHFVTKTCSCTLTLFYNPDLFFSLSLSLLLKKKTNRIFLSEKKAVQVQSQVVDFDNVC